MKAYTSLAAHDDAQPRRAGALRSINGDQRSARRAATRMVGPVLPYPELATAAEAVAEFAAYHGGWPSSRLIVHAWARRIGFAHRCLGPTVEPYVDDAEEILAARGCRIDSPALIGMDGIRDDLGLPAHLARRPPATWTRDDLLLALAQAASTTPGQAPPTRHDYGRWSPSRYAAPATRDIAEAGGGYVSLKKQLASLDGLHALRRSGPQTDGAARKTPRRTADDSTHRLLSDPAAIVDYVANVFAASSDLRSGERVSPAQFAALSAALHERPLHWNRLCRHSGLSWTDLRSAAWTSIGHGTEPERRRVCRPRHLHWSPPPCSRPDVAFPPRLSVPEAIAEFAIYHGALPASWPPVRRWAEQLDIGHRWHDGDIEPALEQAAAILDARDIAVDLHLRLRPRDVRTDLPRPAGLPRRRRRTWTRDDCLAALRQAARGLPPGTRLTTKCYAAWNPGAHNAPSLRNLKQHGGFAALRRQL